MGYWEGRIGKFHRNMEVWDIFDEEKETLDIAKIV